MIISIHVTKSGGTSFGEALRQVFTERFMADNEDWAGYISPEAIARRAANAARMRGRRDELLERYDLIHGHFSPEKYMGLFPTTQFVAFFRDPFQQAVSHYEFLRRIPHVEHPAVQEFHAAKMTIEDFVCWEATKEPQAQLLGGLPVEALDVVGLTEEFARSTALFNATFGCNLPGGIVVNANPARAEAGYEIDARLRKLIEAHRPIDIDLYRRARVQFERQASRRGV